MRPYIQKKYRNVHFWDFGGRYTGGTSSSSHHGHMYASGKTSSIHSYTLPSQRVVNSKFAGLLAQPYIEKSTVLGIFTAVISEVHTQTAVEELLTELRSKEKEIFGFNRTDE